MSLSRLSGCHADVAYFLKERRFRSSEAMDRTTLQRVSSVRGEPAPMNSSSGRRRFAQKETMNSPPLRAFEEGNPFLLLHACYRIRGHAPRREPS